jgi:phosphoglycolate phosphatase
MIKAIIFDFDGTLAKLTLDKRRAKDDIIAIAEKYIGAAAAKGCERYYVVETIYAIEEKCGENAGKFRREAFQRLTELEVEGSHGKDVFPFTRSVLTSLRRGGMKVAILSRSSRVALRLAFGDAEQYVDAVSTREDIRYVKPHPSHMQRVLTDLAIDPSEAVYVGDQCSDITTGKTAKMKTIAVLTGGETKADLEAASPDYIVTDVRDIISLVCDRGAN